MVSRVHLREPIFLVTSCECNLGCYLFQIIFQIDSNEKSHAILNNICTKISDKQLTVCFYFAYKESDSNIYPVVCIVLRVSVFGIILLTLNQDVVALSKPARLSVRLTFGSWRRSPGSESQS